MEARHKVEGGYSLGSRWRQLDEVGWSLVVGWRVELGGVGWRHTCTPCSKTLY